MSRDEAPMTIPSAANFRSELSAQIDRATRQGRPHVEVNAGELHRVVGGYPGENHRMSICCQVMRDEAEAGDATVIYETNSGKGAALTIRYKVPRPGPRTA